MESRPPTTSTYLISTHPGEEIEGAGPGRSKRLALFTLVGLTIVFTLSLLLRPSTGEYFTVCGFKNLTGLPCPGCGLTHSFCALTRGSIAEAFGFNLLGPFLYVVFVLVWVRSWCVLLNREKAVRWFHRIAERLNLVRAFAYGFAVYGLARIIYLLAVQPTAFQWSPLSRLIARLIH